MTTDRKLGARSPRWILGKILAGDVQRNPDFEYEVLRVHGRSRNEPHICSDAVYTLEEQGLVTLHDDGSVSPTGAGRRYAAQQDKPTTAQDEPTTAPAVHFQAA